MMMIQIVLAWLLAICMLAGLVGGVRACWGACLLVCLLASLPCLLVGLLAGCLLVDVPARWCVCLLVCLHVASHACCFACLLMCLFAGVVVHYAFGCMYDLVYSMITLTQQLTIMKIGIYRTCTSEYIVSCFDARIAVEHALHAKHHVNCTSQAYHQ
jgi:hypothetical protein